MQGEKLGADIAVERQAMPARWDWPLASPLKLRANAVAIDWNPPPKSPRLPAEPIAKGEPARKNHADSLRLHEVPHLHVPDYFPD